MCYRYQIAAVGPGCGSIGVGGQHIVVGGFSIGLQRRRRIFFPPSRDHHLPGGAHLQHFGGGEKFHNKIVYYLYETVE